MNSKTYDQLTKLTIVDNAVIVKKIVNLVSLWTCDVNLAENIALASCSLIKSASM